MSPCIQIEHGWLCLDEGPIDMSQYGAKVFMLWHPYCGPTFFRSVNCIKAIEAPGKKTWAAFDQWKAERDAKLIRR